MAAGLFELAYSHEFYNKEINVLSGVSLVFYLIHENAFVLGIVRPILWGETSQMLPNVPTVCKVLLFSAAFIVWALALSILYQKVHYRLIDKISNKLYLNIPVGKMHLSGHVGSNVPVDGKHHWNSLIAMHIL